MLANARYFVAWHWQTALVLTVCSPASRSWQMEHRHYCEGWGWQASHAANQAAVVGSWWHCSLLQMAHPGPEWPLGMVPSLSRCIIIIFALRCCWIQQTTWLIRVTTLYGPLRDGRNLRDFPLVWAGWYSHTLSPSWNPAELARQL
jgi:hypothetical protein